MGVWLTENKNDTRIKPVFVKDLLEVLEWEILNEENE